MIGIGIGALKKNDSSAMMDRKKFQQWFAQEQIKTQAMTVDVDGVRPVSEMPDAIKIAMTMAKKLKESRMKKGGH